VITFGLISEVKDRNTLELLDDSEKKLIEKVNSPNGVLDKKEIIRVKLKRILS